MLSMTRDYPTTQPLSGLYRAHQVVSKRLRWGMQPGEGHSGQALRRGSACDLYELCCVIALGVRLRNARATSAWAAPYHGSREQGGGV